MLRRHSALHTWLPLHPACILQTWRRHLRQQRQIRAFAMLGVMASRNKQQGMSTTLWYGPDSQPSPTQKPPFMPPASAWIPTLQEQGKARPASGRLPHSTWPWPHLSCYANHTRLIGPLLLFCAGGQTTPSWPVRGWTAKALYWQANIGLCAV